MDLYSGMAEPIDVEVEKGNEETKNETSGVPGASAKVDVPVEERLKKRAHRPSKHLMKHLKESNQSPNHGNGVEGASGANGLRAAKNMRRPRNGYGRGLPKKGNFVLSFITLTSSCSR